MTLIASRDITVAGSISAAVVDIAAQGAPASRAVASGGHGGTIALTAGHNITLQSALLSASGEAGGGDIVIKGGGHSASSPMPDPPTLALLGDTELSTSSGRGKGGSVHPDGRSRRLVGHQFGIDASGATGGGDVFVGGGFHGKDPSIANALDTAVAATATIDADATQTGIGGRVAVWA